MTTEYWYLHCCGFSIFLNEFYINRLFATNGIEVFDESLSAIKLTIYMSNNR